MAKLSIFGIIYKVVIGNTLYVSLNTNPPEIQAYAEVVWKMCIDEGSGPR